MERVNDMAKKEQKDAYVRLRHVTIVLLVLAVIAGGGFILTRDYVNQAVQTRQEEIDAQNEELTEQYQQRLAEQTQKEEQGENIQWPEAKQEGWDIVDVSSFALTGTTGKTVSRQDLLDGGLMLVNRWHSIPSDFTEDSIVSVGQESKYSIPVTDSTVRLNINAYNALSEMLTAAKDAGYENYLIQEGYRTNEKQTEYFNNEKAKWESKYTGEALIEKARENTNVPDTSEYQTSFSFKIKRWKKGDTEFNKPAFEDTEHFAWLFEHSWEYGFVFRFEVEGYPTAATADKSWKTGESKKLMIFRYVGKAAAAVMHQEDMCLEEFIEYMIEHPHIAVYENGTLRYELNRVTDTGTRMTVDVVARAAETQVSIDNMGGVIVAMSY